MFRLAEPVLRRLVRQGRETEAVVVLDACTDLYLTEHLPGLLIYRLARKDRGRAEAKNGTGAGGVACAWVRRRLEEAGSLGVDIAELEAHTQACPICRRIKARVKKIAKRKLGALLKAYSRG